MLSGRLRKLLKDCAMKKFDLEAAKAGKPIVTRDGHSARFVTVLTGNPYPLVVALNIDGVS